MGSYQKAKEQVKQTVKINDPEILMSKATQGLIALSIELGVEVLTQTRRRCPGLGGSER